MSDGTTHLPPLSTRTTLRGTSTRRLGLILVIVPFSTSIAPFVMGWLPSPGMNRAASYSTAAAGARVWVLTRTEEYLVARTKSDVTYNIIRILESYILYNL